MGVLTFLLRLSPVWDALLAFWRTKIGKGVILTLAALALVWMYGEHKANREVEAALSEQEIKRREINDGVASAALSAVEAARACRAVDGLWWRNVPPGCVSLEPGDPE